MVIVRSMLKLWCFLLTGLLLPGLASAQLYLSVGGASSELDEAGEPPLIFPPGEVGLFPITDTQWDEEDSGWIIGLGYRWSENFSTEFSLVELGDTVAEADLSTESGEELGTTSRSLNTRGASFSGTAHWPLSRYFSPYIRGGILVWREENEGRVNGVISETDHDTDVSLEVGVGVDIALTEQLGLRGEAVRYDDVNGRDINSYQLGLKYSF